MPAASPLRVTKQSCSSIDDAARFASESGLRIPCVDVLLNAFDHLPHHPSGPGSPSARRACVSTPRQHAHGGELPYSAIFSSKICPSTADKRSAEAIDRGRSGDAWMEPRIAPGDLDWTIAC